jgi:molybdenum cofactor biosynthesis enzyme MoaA
MTICTRARVLSDGATRFCLVALDLLGLDDDLMAAIQGPYTRRQAWLQIR